MWLESSKAKEPPQALGMVPAEVLSPLGLQGVRSDPAWLVNPKYPFTMFRVGLSGHRRHQMWFILLTKQPLTQSSVCSATWNNPGRSHLSLLVPLPPRKCS